MKGINCILTMFCLLCFAAPWADVVTEGEKVIGADREIDSMSRTIFAVYNFQFRVDPTPTVPGPITLYLYVSPLLKGGEITVELTEIDHLISAGPSKISAKADLNDTIRFSIPLVIPHNDTSGISIEIRTNDSMLYIDEFYWVSDENKAGLYRGNPREFPKSGPGDNPKFIIAGQPWDTAAYYEILKNRIYADGKTRDLSRRVGKKYPFDVFESFEPTPLVPGPIVFHMKVYPNFICDRPITAEVTGIDTVEYNGELLLSEMPGPSDTVEFIFPIVIPAGKGGGINIMIRVGGDILEMHYYWLSTDSTTRFFTHPNLHEKPRDSTPIPPDDTIGKKENGGDSWAADVHICPSLTPPS